MTLSVNPNVDVEITNTIDSDVAASVVEEIGLLGTCTAGSTDFIQLLSRDDLPNLSTLLGDGPLARAVRDAFQAGAALIKALRVSSSATGTVGDPDTSGFDGTGEMGLTGTPNDDYQLVFQFLFGGAVGVATFRWSRDAGATWSDPLVTAATVALTGTGLTATFTDGGSGTSFIAGDLVRVNTQGPSPSANDIGTAVDTFATQAWSADGRGPFLIGIANTTADSVWSGLETKRASLHTAHKFVAFIVKARGPDDDESTATWVTALIAAKTVTSPYILGVSGRIALRDGQGLERDANAFGVLMGRLAANPPPRSPGITRTGTYEGPLPGAIGLRPATFGGPEPVPTLTEAQIAALADAGFVTCRTFHGLPGVFFRDGRTMASPQSQLSEIQYVRQALEAAHAVRLTLLLSINSDASPPALRQYETEAQSTLNGLAARGRITEGRAIIDAAQNVAQQGYVAVRILLRWAPTAKWFAVNVQFARALPVAS